MKDPKSYDEWAKDMREMLLRLEQLDLGYPLGDNRLYEPSGDAGAIPKALQGLYEVCDGFDLEDVHVGYFVDQADRLRTAGDRGEPVSVVSDRLTGAVVPFGSDGGGGRFVVSESTESVYYLPSGGRVDNGVYFGDEHVRPRELSENVLAFLWRVHADVAAFLNNDSHHFMV